MRDTLRDTNTTVTMATHGHDHATGNSGEHRGAHETPDTSTPPNEEKLEDGGFTGDSRHLETIRTISKVPGNPHYFEKDGLRTYGDDEDHDHEPPVSYYFQGHFSRSK